MLNPEDQQYLRELQELSNSLLLNKDRTNDLVNSSNAGLMVAMLNDDNLQCIRNLHGVLRDAAAIVGTVNQLTLPLDNYRAIILARYRELENRIWRLINQGYRVFDMLYLQIISYTANQLLKAYIVVENTVSYIRMRLQSILSNAMESASHLKQAMIQAEERRIAAIKCKCRTVCGNRCGCRRFGKQCTDACSFCRNSNCQNR